MAPAYIVAGPVSSGNRLLAAALVRSGCAGEGSTNQPEDPSELPPPNGPYVCILHGGITKWIRRLRELGYGGITVIITMREPIAQARSAVSAGHHADFEDAYHHRLVAFATNVSEALAQRCGLEIVTYEGITEPFLERWLPRLGLDYVPGPLELPGQLAPTEIANQNGKHYGRRAQ